MPNIGGPGSKKRMIMGMAGFSIVLYGAELWEKSIVIKSYREKVEKTIRKLLIRSMAYSTVSLEALYVTAGMMPIECKWKKEWIDIDIECTIRKKGNIS